MIDIQYTVLNGYDVLGKLDIDMIINIVLNIVIGDNTIR